MAVEFVREPQAVRSSFTPLPKSFASLPPGRVPSKSPSASFTTGFAAAAFCVAAGLFWTWGAPPEMPPIELT